MSNRKYLNSVSDISIEWGNIFDMIISSNISNHTYPNFRISNKTIIYLTGEIINK